MAQYIVDTQLPPRLARYLSDKGYNTIHTTSFPDGHLLSDNEIVEIAIRDQRIVISKDGDFFDNYLLKGCPPAVLLLQFGNIKNADLLQHFDTNMNVIDERFEQGAELILFSTSRISEYQEE